ncbi:uncharacterized protein VP01_9911g1, partial [Puccinia sorghi]
GLRNEANTGAIESGRCYREWKSAGNSGVRELKGSFRGSYGEICGGSCGPIPTYDRASHSFASLLIFTRLSPSFLNYTNFDSPTKRLNLPSGKTYLLIFLLSLFFRGILQEHLHILRDYAETWSQPYLMKFFNTEEVAFNEFLDDFKSSFFDHNCQHHAEVALQSLCQTGTVSAYT